jgi:hypothetical protein
MKYLQMPVRVLAMKRITHLPCKESATFMRNGKIINFFLFFIAPFAFHTRIRRGWQVLTASFAYDFFLSVGKSLPMIRKNIFFAESKTVKD